MLKMAISFLVLKFRSTCQKEPRVMLSLAEILYMSIPAILIAIADIIFYYLQTTLRNELVIQAFGSLEIVVIGIASFILLGRSLNGIQWASIMLLCTSVMSIEIGSYDSSSSLLDLPIFPSLLALLCSGLEGTAGVLYEKILKKHNEMNFFHQTMWITLYGWWENLTSSWGSIVHLVFLLFRGWNTFVQSVTYSNFNIYAFLFILSLLFVSLLIVENRCVELWSFLSSNTRTPWPNPWCPVLLSFLRRSCPLPFFIGFFLFLFTFLFWICRSQRIYTNQLRKHQMFSKRRSLLLLNRSRLRRSRQRERERGCSFWNWIVCLLKQGS